MLLMPNCYKFQIPHIGFHNHHLSLFKNELIGILELVMFLLVSGGFKKLEISIKQFF